jgi:hypothetical protein
MCSQLIVIPLPSPCSSALLTLQVHSFPAMPASWIVYWMTNKYDRGMSYPSMASYEGWWREDFQRDAILAAIPKDVSATGDRSTLASRLRLD